MQYISDDKKKKAEGELSNESVDLCTAEQREG